MSLLPQKLLSTSSKEQCLIKLKNLPEFVLNSQTYYNITKTYAAVLVPLCIVDGEVCILYTVRSSKIAHSGQVSFPGGKQDGNETAVETALRETEEEIGVPSQNVDVWGVMSIVQERNTNLVLTPVIGVINNFLINMLKINTDEVEEVLTVPISSLCNPQNHGYIDFTTRLPVFVHDKYKIWGVTAWITHDFLSCFLPDFKMNLNLREFTFDEFFHSKL